MTIDDLINMENGEAIDWLIKHSNDIVLAPRELTLEIREAFNEAHDDFDDGYWIEGSPDDEWAAMVKVIDKL